MDWRNNVMDADLARAAERPRRAPAPNDGSAEMHAARGNGARSNYFVTPTGRGFNNLEFTLLSCCGPPGRDRDEPGCKSELGLKIFPPPPGVITAHRKPESIGRRACFPQSESKAGRDAQAVK